MKLKFCYLILVAFTILLGVHSAWAHSPGQSAVMMRLENNSLYGEINIYYGDLRPLIPELPTESSTLTLDTLRPYATKIQDYISQNIKFTIKDELSAKHPEILPISDLDKNVSLTLPFRLQLPKAPIASLWIEEFGFFDINPQFTTLVTLNVGKATKTVVLSKQRNASELFIDPFAEFYAFFRHGISHICLGLDHMFFLCLLIFTPFLVTQDQQICKSLISVSWTLVKLATAFTVSHSLTLLLAVLHILFLPTALVELCIVSSIIFVGVNCLFPFTAGREWLLVFVFGLFHGYGFSSALTNIGLTRENLAIPLAGFNIGVEAGQLMVILLTLLPLYYLFMNWRGTERLIRCLCGVITLIAGVWFVENVVRLL